MYITPEQLPLVQGHLKVSLRVIRVNRLQLEIISPIVFTIALKIQITMADLVALKGLVQIRRD